MKHLFRIAAVLALGWAAFPAGAAEPGAGPAEADLQNALIHMDQALSQFNSNQADMESAKQLLAGSVLGESERRNLEDRISMDQDRIAAYRAEIISDTGYLRDHWGSLKPAERDEVKHAEDALS